MGIRLASAAIAALLLLVSACSASQTNEPSGPSTPAATPPAAAIHFELVGTYDSSTIPRLRVPAFMAVDKTGQLHVVNAGNSEILVIASGGKVVRRWGKPGSGPGQFSFAREGDVLASLGGIAVAQDGSAYVVEPGNTRVQQLTAGGEPIGAWGKKGRADGQFLDPIGVAVAPSGDVYVVDDERNDIQIFTADGEYQRTIGRPGSEPGQLSDTGNIRIDSDGNVVNADTGNGRVQAWDKEGKSLWTLGSPGSEPGQFEAPIDVALGPRGSLLVVDDTRVQVFDAQRQPVGVWSSETGDHFGALALAGDTLWVEALYPDKLFELRVSWPS
jgi:DNA-binding beta-propeller fold protein YncE